MPVIKLLHTADWQIGKLFGQFEADDASALAEARIATVEGLARLATAEGVDLVLVAGDVFDAQGVADKTVRRLFNALAGYRGPWVMIPGNHDAGLAESVWTRAARLQAIPANVTVCLNPAPVLLTTPPLAILPAPLTQRITYADLTEGFATTDTPAGLPRIGLAHGSVQGLLADGIDSTNPIAAGRAAQARLDYLALGDWHGTRQVDERCWYAGTPETDNFKGNDSGNALLVEIDGPGSLPRVTPVATGHYHWHDRTSELLVSSDTDRLVDELAGFGPRDVIQLNVTGHTDLAAHRRIQQAIGATGGRVRSLAADLSALRLAPTDEDITALQADGYLGTVIDELRQGQEGGDPAAAGVARDALALLASLLDEQRGGDTR